MAMSDRIIAYFCIQSFHLRFVPLGRYNDTVKAVSCLALVLTDDCADVRCEIWRVLSYQPHAMALVLLELHWLQSVVYNSKYVHAVFEKRLYSWLSKAIATILANDEILAIVVLCLFDDVVLLRLFENRFVVVEVGQISLCHRKKISPDMLSMIVYLHHFN